MRNMHAIRVLSRPATAVVVVTVFLAGLLWFQAGKSDAGQPVKTAAAARAIKWYPYQDSLRLGKAEGKKIFLSFYADWCAYCAKMERETFRNPEVVAYLNKYFVSTKVNSDRQKDLAREYNVRGLPSSWFLAENGEAIGNLPGYIPAKMMLKILSFVGSDSYKTMTFQQYLQKM